MTNGEKYKDDIERISKESKLLCPAVRNGKPVSCHGTQCKDCDLYKGPGDGCDDAYEAWIKSEAEPCKKEK